MRANFQLGYYRATKEEPAFGVFCAQKISCFWIRATHVSFLSKKLFFQKLKNKGRATDSKEGAIPWLISSFLSRFAISTDIHGLPADLPRFDNISGKAEHFEEKGKKLGRQSITKKNLVDFFPVGT